MRHYHRKTNNLDHSTGWMTVIFRNCLLQSSLWSVLLYVWEKKCTWVLRVKYPTSGLIFNRCLKTCVRTKKDKGTIRIFMVQWVELPLMVTSLQRPPFFWQTVHAFTLVSTSLQRSPVYTGHFLLSPWWPLWRGYWANPRLLIGRELWSMRV